MKKIAVIGDVMLDVYINVTPKVNYEGAVLAVGGNEWSYFIGASARIGQILYERDYEVHLFAATADDWAADELAKRIPYEFDLQDILDTTIVKLRALVGDNIIARIDCENTTPVRDFSFPSLVEEDFDCIVFSDFNKGIFTSRTEQSVRSIIQEVNCPTVVDPHERSTGPMWEGATISTPNLREMSRIGSIPTEWMAVTMGGDGVMLHHDGNVEHFENPRRVENPQVVGAGDSFTASVAGSLADGADVQTAIKRGVIDACTWVSTPLP